MNRFDPPKAFVSEQFFLGEFKGPILYYKWVLFINNRWRYLKCVVIFDIVWFTTQIICISKRVASIHNKTIKLEFIDWWFDNTRGPSYLKWVVNFDILVCVHNIQYSNQSKFRICAKTVFILYLWDFTLYRPLNVFGN